jgi:hypothetical protein
MQTHAAAHLASGRHTRGVFILRRGYPVRDFVNALFLVWSASQAEEWQDRIEWLPW